MNSLSIEYLQKSRSNSKEIELLVSAYEKTEEYELKLIDQVIAYICTTDVDLIIMKFVIDIISGFHPYNNSQIDCCVCAHCTGCKDCHANFKKHIRKCYTRRNRILIMYVVGLQMPSPIATYALKWCLENDKYFYEFLPYIELACSEEHLMILYVAYSFLRYNYFVDKTADERTYGITLIGNIKHKEDLYNYMISFHREMPCRLTELIGCDIARSISGLYKLILFEYTETGSMRKITQLLYQDSYNFMCKLNNLD